MLITHEVEVGTGGINKNYYKQLGYEIPEIKDNHYRWITPKGTKITVRVNDLPNNSATKIIYSCDKCKKELEIRWVDYLSHKHEDKYYCMNCANKLFGQYKRLKDKLKNGDSFEQWCIENNRQDILDRWDYELNNCLPSEITYRTHNKYYFKCSHGKHQSELKDIAHFTEGVVEITCKQCNSFAQWGIDNFGDDFLEKYWSNKNILNPWDINKGSNTRIQIKCQEKDYHEDYETTCSSFYIGRRCSYCASRKIHFKDSLGQYIIDNYGQAFLNYVWAKKNIKSPFEYSINSHQEVWWNCLENQHIEYKRKIQSATCLDFRCPICVQEMDESLLQKKTREYLESLNYTTLHENNCTLSPKNIITPPNNSNKKRNKGILRYDNEIIINGKIHLFIEVMGQQHKLISTLFHGKIAKKFNITPQEELEYQIAKDKYKEQYVYEQGENYYYLVIWYYDFNKEETYKKLIDNKLKEIKSKEVK